MKNNIAYMKYLLTHKWYVFIASRKFGCSLWRAIVHDSSKFYADEWTEYSRTFYDDNGDKRYLPTDNFNLAWLKHQHRNPHHWQYWILQKDNGGYESIEMPEKYVREMLADWAGAGKAITGKWEVKEWYGKNEHKIKLHEKTKKLVEQLLAGFEK